MSDTGSYRPTAPRHSIGCAVPRCCHISSEKLKGAVSKTLSTSPYSWTISIIKLLVASRYAVGAPFSRAALQSPAAGSGSHSVSTNAAASSATWRVSAKTIATHSPEYIASSLTRTAGPAFSALGTPEGNSTGSLSCTICGRISVKS